MKSEKSVSPRGYTIICDDIREETSKKLTLVGTYGPSMTVRGTFPIVLPKLCFLVHYIERSGVEEGPLTLCIYFPGDDDDEPTVRSELPSERIRTDALRTMEGIEHLGTEPPDPHFSLRLPIEISPCEIKQEGAFRVRMQVGDRCIRIGAMNVTAEPTESIEFEIPGNARQPTAG
jgi:hypothetical protein